MVGENLFQNGDFASGDAGWAATGGELSVAAPVTIDLKLSGPSADVALCAADVKIQPLYARLPMGR
ncbi:hypothetical protein WME94_33055 [Sorangium sp. So ce429]